MRCALCMLCCVNRRAARARGPSRGWFGPLASVNGTTVSVANATGNYTGGVLIVLAGSGAGQWRRILQQRGNAYVLDTALDPTPEPETNVTVIPFRSHMLLTGNTFVNGTTVQLCVLAYGAGATLLPAL